MSFRTTTITKKELISPLVTKVLGDVSPKKSLAFTAIKAYYLGRCRSSEQIFSETNCWVPLKVGTNEERFQYGTLATYFEFITNK